MAPDDRHFKTERRRRGLIRISSATMSVLKHLGAAMFRAENTLAADGMGTTVPADAASKSSRGPRTWLHAKFSGS